MAERRHRHRRYDDLTDAARIRQLEDELADLWDDWEDLVVRLKEDFATRAELERDYMPRKEHRETTRLTIDRAGLAFVGVQTLIGLATLAAVVIGGHG